VNAWRIAVVGLLTPPKIMAAAEEEPLRLNMHPGVTSISHQAYSLHMLVFWVCVVIGAGVFTVMVWSLFRHRRARGAVAENFSDNTWVEITWTVVPALILIGVAIPATRVLLADNDHPDAAVTVDVTGSQWRWHYSYADSGVAFFSNLKKESRSASRKDSSTSPSTVSFYLRDVDHPLILPVGEDVRLRITSDDVIHSWWVPKLGFKRDAIPGYVNEADIVIDKPGTYRGQCAELCGAGHAFMPIVVKALPEEKFQAWLQQKQHEAKEKNPEENKKWTMSFALKKGKHIFNSVCAACHQQDGKGVPGSFPALDGSKVVNGPLSGHLDIVIHGSDKNPVMRAFGKEMNDREIAAVLTYERNAWSNNTGDLVKPEQVEEAR